jgi:hypothetical protein
MHFDTRPNAVIGNLAMPREVDPKYLGKAESVSV